MKKAKLFRNGQSQAIRLPKDFRLEGSEVYIKRQGNCLVVIPATDSWASLVESLDEFSPDFMAEREQPGSAEEREPLP